MISIQHQYSRAVIQNLTPNCHDKQRNCNRIFISKPVPEEHRRRKVELI